MSTKDTNVFEGFFYPKVTKAAELGNTPTPQSEMDDLSAQKEYKGCGCPTCKELNVDCPDCPVCSADMGKAVPSPTTVPSDNVETVTTKGINGWGGSIFDLTPFVK